jgi:hypothetical protein
MKKYNVYLIICALLLCLTSCHDIIEEDIGDKTIHVILPSNGLSSNVYKQVFRWDEVGGALTYRIQIVSPDFDAALTLVCDTSVTGTQFSKTLDPGNYQWKIWAENGNYKTKEQKYDLEILEAPLNEQTVTLKTPADKTVQKSLDFHFTWERVPGADKYLIEIDTLSGNWTSSYYFSDQVIGESVTYYDHHFTKEGTYVWRVTALSSTDQTPPSAPFTLGTFTSKPKAPTPLSPLSGVSAASPVAFSWSAPNDGRANTYTLYLYLNITVASDTLTKVPKKIAVGEGKTSTTYTFDPGNSDAYWGVSTTDKAGNESVVSSPLRKLTTQ